MTLDVNDVVQLLVDQPNDGLVASRRGVVVAVLLALPLTDQIRYLHESEIEGVVDELALQFDDALPFVAQLEQEGVLAAEVRRAFTDIDSWLSHMSEGEEQLWTEAALVSAPEWEQVRLLASRALRLLPAA